MGVNTDGEETGPGSTVTDGVELIAEACEFVQETGNEKSLPQDAHGDVGIQERKMAKEADFPLIQFPKMPSQSSVLNTEHKEAQREHADEGDSFLSNTTTTLQSDAHRKDGNGELSRGAPVSLYANTFVDDTCIPLGECTSPLQSAEIMAILETDAYDTSDAMYNTLLDEISPSDASAFKLEPPFNHDIDETDKGGYTLLYKAALEGDLEGVEDLISRGANPNKPSEDGLRPLHAAAHEGHAHIVDFLILQGADVNKEDEKGNTPLIGAAAKGYMDVIEFLIRQGSHVNMADDKGWTPFNAAVQNGHLEAVKYLMTEGAKQNRYDGMTPLYAAATFGHLDIVKFLFSNGADVNEENDDGMIPLHGAATEGHMEVMEYLIQQGSEVNKGDAKGWTPFNAAVQYGHLEAVKYLITEGVELKRYAGMTPLYAAAVYGQLDIVKFFISNGADVNEEDDDGMIPLYGAAIRGHIEVMEYLIQQGSDLNKENNTGWTPFNAAVQNGHLEAVKYLKTEGAKQNKYDGMTPLFEAARIGHLDLVKLFLCEGADVNEEDYKGRIPLHGAAARGHVKVMEHLIQQGSDVDKTDADGWTSFNAAVRKGHLEAVKYLMTKGAKQTKSAGMIPVYNAAYSGHLDIVKCFISKGTDVNEEDDDGMTPLHAAAACGRMAVMEYLIEQGSDVNKKDNTGWTPFNAAARNGHLEAVKYLMTKGAKQNRCDGKTPVYIAACCGRLDIVTYFISKGVDVNEEDDDGRTPLHGAADNGRMEVMEYLIQQGSDVNKRDCKGQTPLHAAVENGHLEVVKLLLEKGAMGTRLYGLTPLYIATQYDNIDVVNFLVSSGYDVNERNECGKSPLHAACYNGNMDIVKVLVYHNANVNEQDHDGWTPLHAAAQEGNQDIVHYLTLNGADMNVRDIDGLTPLRAAANTAHPHVIEGTSSRRGDPDEENGRDPRSVVHHNLITRRYVMASRKDYGLFTSDIWTWIINEQDHDGWTPLHAAVQEGHQDIVNYLALNGADVNIKDVDGFTPLQAAANAGHLNALEGISSCIGDPGEEETRDPRSGGHQNLIRRGSVTVTMKDADARSRTGELASDVDNEGEGNGCTQADNAKRGADELSLKSLPTRTNDDKKGVNEEQNPFIQAKLKYPDKSEQVPMLDRLKAITCPVTRKRRTTTNGTDCSSSRGAQTWQYRGFYPPNLQTMEADGHPPEEPGTRCRSLIDENRKIRESPSPMIAGNDLPINEPSEIERFPKKPPDVVHQKLYDRNLVSIQGTSSNPVRKIRTKRRTSVDRCPSILALVQTFLQMNIVLAIILAGSPVLVAGRDITERVTLQAGKPGVVPFHFPSSPSDIFQDASHYTLRFESQPRPFCINGEADIKGFKSPSQLGRFTTSVNDSDTSPCLNLMIDNVDALDGDGYILTVIWQSLENVRYETIKTEVYVQFPPGRAKCFITLIENDDYPYEVHCRAITGSDTTTISCYQTDQMIDAKIDITDNGLITRGIFLLPDDTHFSCCSHDVTSYVSAKMCNDFEWPHGKETTRQTVKSVPTSVTTPTPQTESHTESGTCRQFILPSLWHFTYLFINLLAFVTIY